MYSVYSGMSRQRRAASSGEQAKRRFVHQSTSESGSVRKHGLRMDAGIGSARPVRALWLVDTPIGPAGSSRITSAIRPAWDASSRRSLSSSTSAISGAECTPRRRTSREPAEMSSRVEWSESAKSAGRARRCLGERSNCMAQFAARSKLSGCSRMARAALARLMPNAVASVVRSFSRGRAGDGASVRSILNISGWGRMPPRMVAAGP